VNDFFQGSSGVLGQRNVQPLRLLQMIQDLQLSFRQSLARNRHFRSHARLSIGVGARSFCYRF
jgi:hypothetical protein